MQAWKITDPNDNRSVFGFSPLGLLDKSGVIGKQGQTEGDIIPLSARSASLRGSPAKITTLTQHPQVDSLPVPLSIDLLIIAVKPLFSCVMIA